MLQRTILFFSLCLFSTTIFASKQSDKINVPDLFVYSSQQILNEYRENEYVTEVKYKNKTFVYHGEIKAIKTTVTGKPFCIFEDAEKFGIRKVIVMFKDPNDLLYLKKGEYLYVQGRITNFIGSITITNASRASKHASYGFSSKARGRGFIKAYDGGQNEKIRVAYENELLQTAQKLMSTLDELETIKDEIPERENKRLRILGAEIMNSKFFNPKEGDAVNGQRILHLNQFLMKLRNEVRKLKRKYAL